MLIIGFAYQARSGKDTAIGFILEEFSKTHAVERHSFADALKREVCGKEKELCEQYNIPYDENPPMDDPLCNSIHGKQRALLQWYGTEFRRKQDENYWVNKLKEHLDSLAHKPQVVLIGDSRFPNEMQFIKSNKGIVVHVDRPNYDSGLTEEQKNHPSETALKEYTFDYTLSNDCSLEEYKKKACELFLEIYGQYNQRFIPMSKRIS